MKFVCPPTVSWMKSWRISRDVVSRGSDDRTLDKGVRTSKTSHALFQRVGRCDLFFPFVAPVQKRAGALGVINFFQSKQLCIISTGAPKTVCIIQGSG